MHVFQGFAKGQCFVLWCVSETTVDTFSREETELGTGLFVCMFVRATW